MLVSTLCGALSAHAGAGDLRAEIESFLAGPRSSQLRFGIHFHPLHGADTTNTVVYRDDLPIVPASVTKLITALATIDRLGPRHTFATEIYGTLPVSGNGVLDGDLIVIGGGDPFLVSERLWLLTNQLAQSGLRTVRGDLIVDSSRFATHDTLIASVFGSSDRPYAARPSAFAVNFNALTLRLVPGFASGDPVRVTQDPVATDYLQIDDRLVTGPATAQGGWDLRLRADPGAPERPREHAVLTGTLPAGGRPILVYRRVEDPVSFSASVLRAFLEQNGIEIDGETRTSAGPVSVRREHRLLAFESEPVEDLARRMNRYSNNFIANSLALNLAAELSQPPVTIRYAGDADEGAGSKEAPHGNATWTPDSGNASEGQDAGQQAGPGTTLADGGAALTRWLRDELGAGPENHLEEASGLSTRSRLTARTLVAALQLGWNRFDLLPKLLSSLPGPGEEGTLRQRFPGRGRPIIWAKTGTLADARVSSLAGYFEDPGLGPVAFAILMDGAAPWTVDQLQHLQEVWIHAYLK